MMRGNISWKRVFIIFVFLLFPTLVMMAGYQWMIKPLKNQIEQVKQEISTEEKLLSIVQSKEQKIDQVVRSTVQLQNRVPVASLVDQWLLDFDEAATVTDSLIQSYKFNEEDETVETTLEERTKPKTVEIQNPLEQVKEKGTESKQPEDTGPLPQGIKRVTVNLSVTSPNYVQMEQFLSRLEKQDRIVSIDSLSFTGKPEVLEAQGSDAKKEVTYNVQVSTFYAPELLELIKELPYVEYPEPGNRTNPLSIYEEEEGR